MKLSTVNTWKPYVLLLPVFLFILIVVVYGFGLAVMGSLNLANPNERFWVHYEALVVNPSFLASIGFSLHVTFWSTVISLLIGLMVTRYVTHYLRRKAWKGLVWLPMLIPHFVAAYLILLFFAQSGWVSSWVYQLGWITDRIDFPVWVMDRQGIGIIMTYIWKV